MSQGAFRNNPSLRIETGKWSVKVDKLECIAHTDWARGQVEAHVTLQTEVLHVLHWTARSGFWFVCLFLNECFLILKSTL